MSQPITNQPGKQTPPQKSNTQPKGGSPWQTPEQIHEQIPGQIPGKNTGKPVTPPIQQTGPQKPAYNK